jgi:phosphoribosylaminoimidazole-succinocarboxamide synthase
MKKVAEGKTKVIYDAGAARVYLHSKDDITSGDGVRRDVIEGKGVVATRTAANVFRLLNRKGIPTHFLRQTDDTRLLCLRCTMIPLEVTVRGTAAGHWVKRHPEVSEGTDFDEWIIEFTLKDDALHDPLILIEDEDVWKLHDSARPVSSDTLIGEIDSLLSSDEASLVKMLAEDVFRVLTQAWDRLGMKLVDLKIEVGRTPGERIVVADVIDNDSWRLWPGGDRTQQLDKQVYRDGGERGCVLENYRRVAEMTDHFGST